MTASNKIFTNYSLIPTVPHEDDYNLEGGADIDSIYGGAHDGRQGFRRFPDLARSQCTVLPSRWPEEKSAGCEAVGIDKDGWSSLASTAKKSDVVEHYGHPHVPMQLRMLGELVSRRGPGGQSAATMLKAQLMG